MADNIHPVVELLAARMESHPEEFRVYDNSTLAIGGRWETWIAQIRPFMNEAEHEMLLGKAKEVFLQRVHEEVLDELMNGEERRRAEREEYERTARTALGAGSMGARLRATLGPALQRIDEQTYAQQQQKYLADLQAYQNIFPNPQYDPATDTYDLGSGLKMTKAQVEDNPGMVATIKKALGI